MVQSPSWAAKWFAASQEIRRISRNPKVHYRTHKRPPPVSILGQPSSVHIPTSHLLDIHLNIIHPSTPRSPQWSLSLRFPHQDTINPLSSSIRATCPPHLILLDFITRTILGEEYKSFSSSLCNLLHSPVTSSLLGPNILLNTIFSNTLSFPSSRNVSDQVSHPYKTTGKLYFYISSSLNFWIATWKTKDSAPNTSTSTITITAVTAITIFAHSVSTHFVTTFMVKKCFQEPLNIPRLSLHYSVHWQHKRHCLLGLPVYQRPR